MKKKLIKLFKFKNVYRTKNYLIIKNSKWFGIIKHNINCPNFQYNNTSYILFKYAITKII